MPSSRAPDALRVEGLTVAHGGTVILDLPLLILEPGTAWGCQGPSGAGKTTLLHVLAGLLAPARGTVSWGRTIVSALPEAGRDRWRRGTAGIVFQDFHLVPELSALENVLLPTRFVRWTPGAGARDRALTLLAGMGIASPRQRIASLSRGERQRVALARALLLEPRLILADEPTASLDAESGSAITDLLMAAARETGATLFVVSHDPILLARMDHVLVLRSGRMAAGA